MTEFWSILYFQTWTDVSSQFTASSVYRYCCIINISIILLHHRLSVFITSASFRQPDSFVFIMFCGIFLFLKQSQKQAFISLAIAWWREFWRRLCQINKQVGRVWFPVRLNDINKESTNIMTYVKKEKKEKGLVPTVAFEAHHIISEAEPSHH